MKSFGAWGVFAGILSGLQNFAYVLAVQNTSAANALVILASSSLWAAILSVFILSEAIPARTIITALICFGSIALIFSTEVNGSDNNFSTIAGDFFALLCAIILGLYFVILRVAALKQGYNRKIITLYPYIIFDNNLFIVSTEPDVCLCNLVGGILVIFGKSSIN